MLVQEMLDFLNEIAPFDAQEAWDNSGLQVGQTEAQVHRVLVSLDAAAETVEEARRRKCDCIVTHHPFLFHAVKQLSGSNPAFLAAKYGIAAISAHTSYDKAAGGVQDILAKTVQLRHITVAQDGLLRIGVTDCKTALEFAETVQTALHAAVAVSLPSKPVHTVALCSGAGADLWQTAKTCGADLFLTGEMKHHEVLDANAAGLATVAAGHFETEQPAMTALLESCKTRFPGVEFCLSEAQSPIKYI